MGQQTSRAQITDQDKAIFQLKRQRDAIKQYQKRLATVAQKQHDLARQAMQDGKTEKAKFYLRSKKHQQLVIDTTYTQVENLEKLIGTIEFKLIEKDVMYGLQQGNATLKRLNQEMSVERIDGILDDLNEETVKVDEVLDMLGMQLSNKDETEVDEEFERMLREERPEISKGPEIRYPEAPKEAPKAPEAPEAPQESKESNEPMLA